jgi:flagella basal body P-ring formation protein FlgA
MRIFLSALLAFMLCAATACAAAATDGETVRVKENEVRRVIEDFIRQRTANLGIDINVKKIGYNGDLTLPAGELEYEVSAPRQWEGWGSAMLALIVRVNGQVKRNIPVKVDVDALTDMVVTTRQMEQGYQIKEADVVLQKRNLATSGDRALRNIDEVIGKRLKRTVRGNMLLSTNMLEKVPLVKNGQIVTIVLENDFMKITAKGRVRGAGAAGDLVPVQNLSSQKDIQARVIDQGTVRVEY